MMAPSVLTGVTAHPAWRSREGGYSPKSVRATSPRRFVVIAEAYAAARFVKRKGPSTTLLPRSTPLKAEYTIVPSTSSSSTSSYSRRVAIVRKWSW